jgi:hypothetical protein
MNRTFVKPLGGKIIPMPDNNGDLPQAGKHVTLNSFWYRRERDKDVEFLDVPEVDAPAAETSAAAPADAEDQAPTTRKGNK